MIALSGPRTRSLTSPNHCGTCRSRLQASWIRLMKLMYTGHSRNGKIVPGEADQGPDRPQALRGDHPEQRHRVRLAERQRRQVLVEPPVARAPAHLGAEAEVPRHRVDVHRVREHADHQRAEQGDQDAAADVAPHLAGDVGRVLEADELEQQHRQEEREDGRREDLAQEVVGLAGQERRLAGRGDVAAVTPPVYCGRCCWKSARLVASRPKTSIATNASTPKPASTVTTRWKVRVGSSTTTAISASTTRQPMNPGVPVMPPVESVNQVLESWKKSRRCRSR